MDELKIEERGAICTLVINRPDKHNALTDGCLGLMVRAMKDLAGEGTVRAVVIRGAGEKAFSAGYDIASLPVSPSAESEKTLRKDPPLEAAMKSIRAFPYPVIAMIHGLAVGGGCELAVACDLRIGGQSAIMGMPPAKLGLVYPYDGLRRFVRVLGFSRTLELFLTARRYDSASCLRLGLLNEVVEDGDLETHTMRLAEETAGNAPLSLKGMKAALYRMTDFPLLPEEDEEAIRTLFAQSLQSEDIAEARKAFLEKRSPRFKGR
jgi:enoyl-CoA hydratase/carnithine racemase